MISRKIEKRIKDFFTHDHRALLVEGAHQTGKTYSIRRVGKECFENLVAQEFYAHGYAGFDHSLYYFNSKKQGELNFVIESKGLCPLSG